MPTLTLSISIERILENIHALSAMRTYVNQHRERLVPLTADRNKTLRLIAGNSYCYLLSRLAANVVSCTMPVESLEHTPDEPDIMEVTLEMPEGFNMALAPALRKAAELFITFSSLKEVYQSVDPVLADDYHKRAGAALNDFTDLTALKPVVPNISPYY